MPKYEVIAESGVQITGLGFFRKEQIFEAPSSWTPSRLGVIALDAEGEALQKAAKEAYVARLEARSGKKLPPEEREELLRMPGRPGVKAAPEPEMVAPSKVAAGAPVKEAEHAEKGKHGRAADR
jgi:hypothetical protein